MNRKNLGQRAPRRLLRGGFLMGLFALLIGTFPRSAPASIEEQRARLPPPAKCTNDVEGTWVGLRWSSHRTPPEWYYVTLEVKFVSPENQSQIKGDMSVRFWHGGATAQTPPGCGRGERVVLQTAKGTYADGQIDFQATSWRSSDAPGCGYNSGYYLDHYSGRIDPVLKEFQAVNNDGGYAVNEPTVFRRIKCADEPGPTTVPINIKPPTFTPPKRWGCGKG